MDKQYLTNAIEKYTCISHLLFSTNISALERDIEEWAKNNIVDGSLIPSGSKAKGTAISLSSDYDLFIPLKVGTKLVNNENPTLKDLYDSLYDFLKKKQYTLRKQNVSIKVILSNGISQLKVDVTPGRKEDSSYNYNDYWLYCNRGEENRVKTNIKVHIDKVKESKRINEIKLLKILRSLYDIDFPSIYLECLLIDKILKYKNTGDDYLLSNFNYIIQELSKENNNSLINNNPLFDRLEDPANSNNILSKLLIDQEKESIIKKIQKIKQKTIYNMFNNV